MTRSERVAASLCIAAVMVLIIYVCATALAWGEKVDTATWADVAEAHARVWEWVRRGCE